MIKSLIYPVIAAWISVMVLATCSSEIMTLPMGVSMDNNPVTLSPGESVTLTAEVVPDEAIVTTLIWSSSNTGVATVENGVVRAIAEGETTISVSITTHMGEKRKSCLVTVIYPVHSLTIDKNTGYMSVGESLVLTAEVLPENAPDKSFTWKSSNPDVATVADGVVTAHKPGSAIISATTTVGERIANCYIRVLTGKYIGMNLQHPQHTTLLLSGSGTIEIDWGDGSASETYTLFPAVTDSLSHDYADISDRIVIIEGDDITVLNCSSNRLTSLDVSKSTKLTVLDCSNNQLENPDVSKNAELTTLNCSHNPLLNLDVTGNIALTTLYCVNNQLTELNLQNNVALKNLNCSNNQLTNLDVSANVALTGLYCSDNQLTNLDVSANVALTGIDCSNNRLTGMDVSMNTALTDFNCDNNPLNSLNVSNTSIISFSIVNSTDLETFTVCDNRSLRNLYCSGNQTSNLILRNNNELRLLDCSGNQIKSLDVNSFTSLTQLYCYDNQLTNLDLSKNNVLNVLDCSGNQLRILDLSKNTTLTQLDCSDNPFQSFDVSKNTALMRLHCSKNQLTELDLSKNIALTHLNCQINQLIKLDLSNNTNLLFVQCQTNQLTYDALLALFGTLHDKTIYTNKPICIYGNPGLIVTTDPVYTELIQRTRWFIYLANVNPYLMNPWEFIQ